MSKAIHVTEQTFSQEVLQSPLPVLVDFYADWCGPCRMLAPTLDKLATEFAGRAKIAKVNVDEQPGLANEFQVSSIPTLVLLADGQVAGRAEGLVAEAGLRQALNTLVQTTASQKAE